jgi:hypothetical protein
LPRELEHLDVAGGSISFGKVERRSIMRERLGLANKSQ